MTNTLRPDPESPREYDELALSRISDLFDEFMYTRDPETGATILSVVMHDDIERIVEDPTIWQFLIDKKFVHPGAPSYFLIEHVETTIDDIQTHHRVLGRGQTTAGDKYTLGSSIIISGGCAIETLFVKAGSMKSEDAVRLERYQHNWSAGCGEDRKPVFEVDPVLSRVLAGVRAVIPRGTIVDLSPEEDL